MTPTGASQVSGADVPPADEGPPLLRLWRYAGGHRRQVVVAALWSVCNTVLDLGPPFLIGFAVDVVVQRQGSFLGRLLGLEDLAAQLWALAGLTAAVWVAESLSQYRAEVAWRDLAQTIEHEARLDVYGHVQGLEMAYFEDRSTGGLMAVLNDDVNQLERFLDHGANDLLQVAAVVVLVGGAFFTLVPAIAPLAFLPIPAILWGSFRFQARLEPRYDAMREQVARLNAALANNLSGMATIQAFTAEDRERRRIAGHSAAYRRANEEAIRYSAAFEPLIRIAVLVGFVATLVLGGLQVLDGALPVGIYAVLVFLTQRLLWPLTRLGEVFDQYQRAMASTRRLLGLLAVRPAIVGGRAPLPRPVRGRVAFRGVTFAYGGGRDSSRVDADGRAGRAVLDGLALEIPAGQTHAVVGATGAGKSTIVKLLLRLYDPTAGRVLLDGRDIRELALPDLRGAIGLVSQEVFLFQGSVRDNIAYGRPDADDREVVRAARLAEAHPFITALPDGYATAVGERGQKLSGGQRQRLAIARAVLTDPAVLVLDEATSAVDNETEAAIQRALDHIAASRTTLVIAHRLSTVRTADRIHVLQGGRVAESGTHDELVARAGLYAALWRVQTGQRTTSTAPEATR